MLYAFFTIFRAVLQAIIVSRSVKLTAKVSVVITLLKLLSIIFIVVVCIAGIIRRGIYIVHVHPVQVCTV